MTRGTVGCCGALIILVMLDPLYPPLIVALNDSSDGGLALYCPGSTMRLNQSSGKSEIGR